MALKVKDVEDIFLKDNRGIVLNVMSTVAQNRRGGEVRDNEASVRVEITSASEREITFKQLSQEWEKKFKELKGFQEVGMQKFRFGSSSGSPIVIEIQENNFYLPIMFFLYYNKIMGSFIFRAGLPFLESIS